MLYTTKTVFGRFRPIFYLFPFLIVVFIVYVVISMVV